MAYLLGLKNNKLVEIHRSESPGSGAELSHRLVTGEIDSIRSVESIVEILKVAKGDSTVAELATGAATEFKDEMQETWTGVSKDLQATVEDIKKFITEEAKTLKELPKSLFSEVEWAKIVLAKAKFTDWLTKLSKKE